jgi:hypothetical protein
MLEIIAIIAAAKRIGTIMREKGRKGGWYQFLLVVLWIGGEFVGAIIGTLLTGGRGGLLVYVFALMGAAAGAAITFSIANNAASDTSMLQQQIARGSMKACPYCGLAIATTARTCEHCRRDLPAAITIPASTSSVDERLRHLDHMRTKNLITDQEFQDRRQTILKGL